MSRADLSSLDLLRVTLLRFDELHTEFVGQVSSIGDERNLRGAILLQLS